MGCEGASEGDFKKGVEGSVQRVLQVVMNDFESELAFAGFFKVVYKERR